MNRDYTAPLWLLKLGAPLNVYFLLNTSDNGDLLIAVPAWILFAVSAFRCLFPVLRAQHCLSRLDVLIDLRDAIASDVC